MITLRQALRRHAAIKDALHSLHAKLLQLLRIDGMQWTCWAVGRSEIPRWRLSRLKSGPFLANVIKRSY